jgi:septal ring factor EnvC (AmiA/AmiB activator)
MSRRIFAIIFLLIPLIMVSQENNQELTSAKRQLQQIRTEINQLQTELNQTEEKLESELSTAENLDRQINLVQKALSLLKKEISKRTSSIASLNEQINVLKNQISALQEVFSKQILFAYKHQRGRQLAWILGSESFHQAMIRYLYFNKISQQARSYYDRLTQKKTELSTLQTKLQTELENQRNLAAEKEKEQENLETKQASREKVIKKITRNKTLLSKAIDEKRRNYKEIEKLIAQLQQQKPERNLSAADQTRWEKLSGDFDKNKGKLNWPVNGKVIHRFGKYKNPELKTVLNNTGIDIRSEKGTEIRCVFPGIVSLITYMSGFGNTVIVDHKDGYYTVYTHMDDVLVSKFQFIESGEIIGSVGTSGSLEGAMLHFEIYGNNVPLNPLSWLKKM